jgi:hypothetical protein
MSSLQVPLGTVILLIHSADPVPPAREHCSNILDVAVLVYLEATWQSSNVPYHASHQTPTQETMLG